MAERTITPDLARTCWNDAAEPWDHFVEHKDVYRHELHGKYLLEACGDVADENVVELGCGQGWFCRRLAERGANVTGIDWSDGAIGYANQHEANNPLGITYHVMDARSADEQLSQASFDLVTGCHSLMDVPEPDRALKAAAKLMKRDGRLVFSICHPGSDTPYREWDRDENGNKIGRPLKINHYFDRLEKVMHWNMQRLIRPFDTVQYRWTIEQWSEMIAAPGLLITRIREPRPTPEQVKHHPDLEDAARLPYSLIFECIHDPR